MRLILLGEKFSVCRLSSVGSIGLQQPYTFLSITDDEISLVCPSSSVPENATHTEADWRALKIEGTLEFSMVGVIAGIAGLLAQHNISVFVISTYNTDYILLKEPRLAKALELLAAAGYSIAGEQGEPMKIRREQPADYEDVYKLVNAAFATSTNEGEWDYLNEVRKKGTFLPELSLVAVLECSQIAGQIVLHKTVVQTPNGGVEALLLSPISVHPRYFRRGIATAMITAAFARAAALGYCSVFLCGEPGFYHKFGFRPTYSFGICHVADKEKNAEWCMAKELVDGALVDITGFVDIE